MSAKYKVLSLCMNVSGREKKRAPSDTSLKRNSLWDCIFTWGIFLFFPCEEAEIAISVQMADHNALQAQCASL